MTMATMKELREECAKLGITPGRSIAETEKRIAEHPRRKAEADAEFVAWCEAETAASRARVAALAPKPRMSRTMRMLADCTAICGTLARNPLIYGGDEDRHDYATGTGYLVAVRVQARHQWQMRQPWPTPRKFV